MPCELRPVGAPLRLRRRRGACLASSLVAFLGVTTAGAALVHAAETPAVEPSVRARGAFYIDSQDTIIWSPSAKASAAFPVGIDVTVDWVSDVITSASVDVVTAATAEMTELRTEFGATASWENMLPDLDATVGYRFSFERDAYSHVASLSLAKGFATDALVVGLNQGLSYNKLGLPREPWSSWQPLWVYFGDLSFTLVVDKKTLVDLIYSAFIFSGYQENPYRRVPIMVGGDLIGAQWLPESVPDFRFRNSLTLRARRALTDTWMGGVEYRFYLDDWGLMAHTESANVVAELGKGLHLEIHERFSYQTGTSFYEERYTEVTEFRTRDRRMSPHLSAMLGVAAYWEIAVKGKLELDLRVSVDGLMWHFGKYLAPELTINLGAGMVPLGWVFGGIAQIGLEVHL